MASQVVSTCGSKTFWPSDAWRLSLKEELHEVPADSSVPQGSPWPHPFSVPLYINDLPKAVKSQVHLFADDRLLYRRIDSQQDYQILQSDLTELEWWADTWGMHFNTNFFCYNLYSQYPQVLRLPLLEQPHITTSWLQSIPGSYTNPWPEMDDSQSHQHHKESQLHPKLQENSLHLPCLLFFRRQCCSLGSIPTKWHWQARKHPEMCSSLHQPQLQRLHPWMCHHHAETPRTAVASSTTSTKTALLDHSGCVTNMLRDVVLQSLQNRRKQQWQTLFFKTVTTTDPPPQDSQKADPQLSIQMRFWQVYKFQKTGQT